MSHGLRRTDHVLPTDDQWERLRYYVYDQEDQMSFYCGGWDVIKCDKKSH